jgi:hypothetical protein
MTRRVVTNDVAPETKSPPLGQLAQDARVDSAERRFAYTTAFFDVGDEPWVLETPDMDDRYIVLPSLRMTNLFEVPGQDNAEMAHSCFMDA